MFTTETQRTQREFFFDLAGGTAKSKSFQPRWVNSWSKTREIMENRYLPILHKNIFLRVSNESRLEGRACLREAASA
jgi:hypothetical protein